MADDFGASLLNNHFSFGIGNPDTTLESTTNVTTGEWFHVAATRTASTGVVQVFVNGVLEAQQTLANTRPLLAQSMLTLGANTVDGRYFNGWMDEVRIWNSARSATDLRTTMRQRLAGNEPGLVAYWRFDEPGSMLLTDSSPSHEGAAIVGTATWVPPTPPCANRAPTPAPTREPIPRRPTSPAMPTTPTTRRRTSATTATTRRRWRRTRRTRLPTKAGSAPFAACTNVKGRLTFVRPVFRTTMGWPPLEAPRVRFR